MAKVMEAFKFRHPSNIMIAGPSGSGKTVFTTKLILQNHNLWPDTPRVVHYCYGVWQKGFDILKKNGVQFHAGVPDTKQFDKWYGKDGGLLILDDLMEEVGKNKEVLDIFTKLSHHRNITVLYLSQDLFPPGKFAKTISRNAHYIVAFKSPRDKVGIRTLLTQAYPGQWLEVLEKFNEVTSGPFGYMVFDFHPASNDSCRILSHILKGEGYTHCYMP